MYYIGLPKTFIAGSVFCNESKDCLEGVEVTLANKASEDILTATTNNYGDFEFDGLEAGPVYSIKLNARGYYPMSIEDILLEKDVSLGNLYLQRKRW